jgi:hypothetical protein
MDSMAVDDVPVWQRRGQVHRLCAGMAEARRVLPSEHQHLTVHQHFGLTSSTFDVLDASISGAKTTTFTSCFYDTRDFDLMRQNLWLVEQDDVWTLKHCTPATDENLVIFHAEDNRTTIEQKLAQWLKSGRDFAETFFPYVTIQTTRRSYVSSGDYSLYVDAVRFDSNDYYLVGTLCLARGSSLVADQWPSLEFLEVFTPVRSRVTEFIATYKEELYTELVAAGTLPRCPFYSGELNHHRTNPLDALMDTPVNVPVDTVRSLYFEYGAAHFDVGSPLPTERELLTFFTALINAGNFDNQKKLAQGLASRLGLTDSSFPDITLRAVLLPPSREPLNVWLQDHTICAISNEAKNVKGLVPFRVCSLTTGKPQ